MPGDGSEHYGTFPRTRWSLVARARDVDVETKRRALTELLLKYQPALRAHLVYRRGMQVADANDMLQEFVASKVLDRRIIERAEQERGKFRSFLLASLERFVMNRSRREKAVALPSENEAIAPASEQPDRSFDVAWARELLLEAVERMRAACQASGRLDVWGVFGAKILGPALDGAEEVPYPELVTRFHFSSPREACNILITGKRMFVRILREVIGEYESDEAGIDAEILDLQKILACSKGGPHA